MGVRRSIDVAAVGELQPTQSTRDAMLAEPQNGDVAFVNGFLANG